MCRITGAVRVFGKTAPCRKQPAAARTAPNRNGSCLYRKIEYIHRMRNGKESFLLSPKQVYHRFDYLSRKECGAVGAAVFVWCGGCRGAAFGESITAAWNGGGFSVLRQISRNRVHFCDRSRQRKIAPRKTRSMLIPSATPMTPQPSHSPNSAENSSRAAMVSVMDTTMVNFTSPAARSPFPSEPAKG